jgi:GTP-binding protein EngB required for normal cell division
MSLTGRLRDALRRDDRVDADRLVHRVAALDRFAQAAGDHVPAGSLRPARAIVERAGGRLALSRDHTVVALAGATGSGKSSLFNALTAAKLSNVGVRRPTTGATHACVWNGGQDAGGLLDWLGIRPDRRFTRVPDDAQLRGLILLDLPDFDSILTSHRIEVDRLLRLVDLVIWVTDPQKYADQVIHEQYLRTFHRHVDSTVVVLNQADLLTEADARRCLADLSGLLANDGFRSVTVFAVSAVADRSGIEPLRRALQKSVSERMAALRRLTADVDGAVDALTPLVGSPAPSDSIDRDTTATLSDALADSAGVRVVVDATERAYKFRARASMGWPLVRWIRRVRTDPLRRLRLGITGSSASEASSLPRPDPARRSVASLAVRAIGDRAGRGLPDPWPAAVTAAARSRTADLPDALDQAVVTTDIGMERERVWWRMVGALQWLVTVIAIVGGLWLLVRIALIGLGLATIALPSYDVLSVGHVPLATVLLIGGAIAGILISLLVKPLVSVGAKRARRRANARLRTAITQVSNDLIVAPVQGVLHDYGEARAALDEARQ